ncbi:MAG: LysM peptidoglycan-binding domain-containing protein [Calditerrivibrio sp.]|nr:LysM peptidoglycan-binding domain-containing protein [Calditerrivibrio sp.]MCA1933168.1 LysM peptidoglycan-binding domain-containing protein [Calditerrivibrio sp.]MCA1980107.1 LysM peptidoglycan-binding domain-containing protein [Calditerrivibrio sp.]
MNRSFILFIVILFPFIVFADLDYSIKRHDTLWGISKKFYKNPFKWPVIWKYNTYITNPDLIYPKKIVRIPLNGSDNMTGMEINLQGFESLLSNNSKDFFDTEDFISLKENTDSVRSLGFEIKDKDSGSPKVNPIIEDVKKALVFYKDKQFEVAYDIPINSDIVYISDDKYNAYTGDFVYVRSNKGFMNGDRVTFLDLVRKDESISIYTNAGEGVVVNQKNGDYKIKVTKVYDAIRSGLKVVNYIKNDFPIPRDVLSTDLKKSGYILSLSDDMSISGSGYKVLINIGLNDGIKPGDTFSVYRVIEEKGFSNTIELGEGVVIFSQDKYSTLYIMKSNQEIHKGDSVRLNLIAVQ